MLKIAICDDEVQELSYLKTLINEYAKKHPQLNVSCVCCQSSEELLLYVQKDAFHIYLLDIIMKGKDGIAIGEAIRNVDKKAAIIYTTSSPDYAVQSYTVNAFYYLLKPLGSKDLFPILDRAAKSFEKKINTCLLVRTRDGLFSIKKSTIVYIEYHSHSMSYYLEDGTVINSLSFRENFDQASEAILADELFAKISKSYIINFSQVEHITKKGFFMKNGTEISVSRLYTGAKKAYMDYILEEKGFHGL